MGISTYLRDIGRGAAGARALARSDAQALMGEVLDGHVTATEVGAFVMAMRMKGETLDELTGFLAAVHQRCVPVPSTRPVVLIPSYNGSRKLPNLTPLLALWLAREGLHVLVHGPLTEPSRVTSAAILSMTSPTPGPAASPPSCPPACSAPACRPCLMCGAWSGCGAPGTRWRR
jgi:anthranilate phosphoribosyltransferase